MSFNPAKPHGNGNVMIQEPQLLEPFTPFQQRGGPFRKTQQHRALKGISAQVQQEGLGPGNCVGDRCPRKVQSTS